MKTVVIALLLAAAPALGLAQTAQPAAKPAGAKPAAAKPAAAQAAPGRNAKLAPSAQKAVEENTPIEEPEASHKLTEAELEVARKVHVGEIPCELGATVKVTPMRREGFFLVQTGRNRFRMHPVESRTGAVRLEDPMRGAMWLQLGNKSMLMSQKIGQRLADECQSPDQATFAEAMKNRPAVNILEPAPVVRPAVPAEALPPGSMPAQGNLPPTAAPAAAAAPLPAASPAR